MSDNPIDKKEDDVTLEETAESIDDEAARKAEEQKKVRQQQVQQRRDELRKKVDERPRPSPPPKPPVQSLASSTPSVPVTSTTPAVAATPKPIREDIVASCINFLNHPKVKGSPQEQKVLFLKKKGLTQEEIDEALRRADGVSAATPAVLSPQVAKQQTQQISVPSNLPPMAYPGYQVGYPAPMIPPGFQLVPQQQLIPANQTWYSSKLGFVSTAAALVSVGVGVALLAKRYLFTDNSEVAAKLKAEEEKKREEERAHVKVLEELTTAIKSLQTQNTEMKDLLRTLSTEQVNSQRQSTSPQDNNTKMLLSEMQSQLNTLKAQLVDMRAATPEVKSTSSRPGWTPASQRPAIPAWQQQSTTPTPLPQSSTTTTTTTSSSETTSKPEEKPQTNDAHPYSNNFKMIAEMVARGETPPGIKQDINDKPLFPLAKVEKGDKESAPKPWLNKPESEKAKIEELPSELESTVN